MVAKWLVDYNIRKGLINNKLLITFPQNISACLRKTICSLGKANFGMPLGFIFDLVLCIILMSWQWWQVLWEWRFWAPSWVFPRHLHCSESLQGHKWQHCHGSQNSLLNVSSLWSPSPHPVEAWPPWCQAQDELDFTCHMCKNPPCTHSSASTCFSPMFSESTDIQKCFLKQLFDQPHQPALPFSSKTASFYSLLKIAISLKPEDTVIHVVVKRKKGYFFCFGLWEESRCAIPVPAGLVLAPPWPSWPHRRPQWFWHSLLCHLAAIWDAGAAFQCPSWLWREGFAVTATTENKPVRWQVADLCLGFCRARPRTKVFLIVYPGQRGNAATLSPFRFLMKVLTPLQVQFKDRRKSQVELTSEFSWIPASALPCSAGVLFCCLTPQCDSDLLWGSGLQQPLSQERAQAHFFLLWSPSYLIPSEEAALKKVLVLM